MLLTKSGLCGQLLEDGEEDLAVLLARSDLPEILDTTQHAEALSSIGLGQEHLAALLPAIDSDPNGAALSDEDAATLKQTISDRWAYLVNVWLGRAAEPPSPGDREGDPQARSMHHA